MASIVLNQLQTIDINCKGVLNGIAAVLPKMLERKSGHVVNISSDAGRKVFAGLGVYSASKMFVEAVSQVRSLHTYFFIYLIYRSSTQCNMMDVVQTLRLENIGSGLRVTTIQPGNVATELVNHGNAASGVDEEAMKLY